MTENKVTKVNVEYLKTLDSQVDSAIKHLLIVRRILRRLQPAPREVTTSSQETSS